MNIKRDINILKSMKGEIKMRSNVVPSKKKFNKKKERQKKIGEY